MHSVIYTISIIDNNDNNYVNDEVKINDVYIRPAAVRVISTVIRP